MISKENTQTDNSTKIRKAVHEQNEKFNREIVRNHLKIIKLSNSGTKEFNEWDEKSNRGHPQQKV